MKKGFLSTCIALLFSGVCSPTTAGEVDRLLEGVQKAHLQERQTDIERQARFLSDKNQQQKWLNEAKTALAKAEAESKRLRAEFASNETTIASLQSDLKKQSGDLTAVFSAAENFKGVLKDDWQASLISAQFPDRLLSLKESKAFTTIPQLESVWIDLLQEMVESGKTVSFLGKMTDKIGMERTVTIYRIGSFSAFAEGKYLQYVPETAKLVEGPTQPDPDILSTIQNVPSSPASIHGLIRLAIDPTGGKALQEAHNEAPSWLPRSVRSVINNAVDASVFCILFFASVWATSVAIERWLFYRQVDVRKYSSKIVLETDLTRHLTVIGTVAGNAPYVGLLGTVLGIMLTFHKMGTEKGSMDVHNIMLGLSTALKATAVGLMVAIPCVVFNNLLRRRIRELVTAYEVKCGP